MGKHDRAAPPAPQRLARAAASAAEHRGVEHQRRVEPLASKASSIASSGGPCWSAAADHHRVRAFREIERARRSRRREAALSGFLEADHPRLRHRDAERGATLAAVAIWSLPAPARSAADAGEQGGAGHFAAAGDDQQRGRDPPCRRPREWRAAGRSGEAARASSAAGVAHRAATIASGAEVTGAASSISGAAKL